VGCQRARRKLCSGEGRLYAGIRCELRKCEALDAYSITVARSSAKSRTVAVCSRTYEEVALGQRTDQPPVLLLGCAIADAGLRFEAQPITDGDKPSA
jgi:hypothetical protein